MGVDVERDLWLLPLLVSRCMDGAEGHKGSGDIADWFRRQIL